MGVKISYGSPPPPAEGSILYRYAEMIKTAHEIHTAAKKSVDYADQLKAEGLHGMDALEAMKAAGFKGPYVIPGYCRGMMMALSKVLEVGTE